MNSKYIKDNFLVVSDYNWLPENLEDSWVHKLSDNYLIYDRYHRYPESDKVKWQKNVGQNIYDIFDFVHTHYDNLPETTIFCRAAFLFPKDTGTPRYNEKGEKLSNGNCSEEYFLKVCNNKTFTELNDFSSEHWRFNWSANRIGPDNSYLEINNSWYFGMSLPRKYYNNIDDFFRDFYVNPYKEDYIRFSPGGCYIIPKQNLLKYNMLFYEKMKEILGWESVIAEAHMIERALYIMFNSDIEIKDEYKAK